MSIVHPATHPSAHPAGASADPGQDRSERCAYCLEDRTERHLRMLQELAEIGMKLARAVEQQALNQAVPDQADTPEAGASDRIGGGDLALVFSRIARAVRQTLALEAKLAENRRTLHQSEEAEQVRRAALIAGERKKRQKARVKRIVEDAIDAEFEGSDRENLLIDLDLRLDDEDLFADYDERPFGETIARICRDLGITPDMSLWEAEDWGIEAGAPEVGAAEETGAAPSPFASPEPNFEYPPDPQYRPDPAYWPDPGQTGGFSPQPPRAATSGSDPP